MSIFMKHDWRAFVIENEAGLILALRRYREVTGNPYPTTVRVSARAPQALVDLINTIPGVEIDLAPGLLSLDVWFAVEKQTPTLEEAS